MELTEDQYRLIEAYLDGTLDPVAGEAFLALKESSAAFREELNRQLAVIATLKAEARAQLKAQLKKDFQAVRAQQGANGIEDVEDGDLAVLEEGQDLAVDESRPPKTKRRSIRIWYGLAASIVVLVGFVVFLTQWMRPASHEAVFDAYFHPYSAPPSVRHGGSSAELEAIGQYREGNFAVAIPLLKEGLLADSADDLLRLYLGNAYLALDSVAQARRYFEAVLASAALDYEEQAEWYCALAELKGGEVEAAKLRFGRIISSGSPYGSQAREVLADLGE